MVSVTSIAPSGVTMISDWKFSMRSSRVLKAEAAGKTKAKTSAIAKSKRIAMQRARVIPSVAPASCRWRAEADLRCFPLGRRGDFEEFTRLEPQHVCEDVRGELLNLGVQVADHRVVIAPRVLHGVFDLRQRGLQRREALNRAKLRIRFGKRKQALQRAGNHVLRLSPVTGAGRGHRAISPVPHPP